MLQYSSIDEAWGDAFPPARKKKRAPRPPSADAAVDEQTLRFPTALAELKPWSPPADLIADSPDSRYAPYDKEPGQRSDAVLPQSTGPERRSPAEPPARLVQVAQPPAGPPVLSQSGPPARSVRAAPGAAPPESALYDVFLYVFTGVVLILLLEQFVQLGTQLGRR